MNADRLFMLVDTCANIDEVKHEFPDLDFLTYFYALLGYYCIPTIKLYNETKIDENTLNGILNGKIQPQRDDLIQMSLVLNIDLKKTNFMLSLAECESLSYKESRDSLIICAIKNHYSINKTNITIFYLSKFLKAVESINLIRFNWLTSLAPGS